MGEIIMTDLQKDELIKAMTNNLQMLRVRLGLTQVQMAEMIGVGRQTYLAVEKKHHKMSWNMFLSLLMVFTKNDETDAILNVTGIYTDELNDFLKRKI